MSNDNIERIEEIVELTEQVPYLTGALFASLAWSFGGQLVNQMVKLHRVHDPKDAFFARLTPQRKEDTIRTTEERVLEIQDILPWVAARASAEFLPTGDQLTDPHRVVNPDEDDDTDEEKAEQLDITVEELHALQKENAEIRAEVERVQRAAIEANRKHFVLAVNGAVNAPVPSGLELSDQDAVRILDKIAQKLEQHERRQRRRGAITRRRKTRLEISANCRLMADAMNKADEAAERIGMEEVADSEPMTHNRRAQQQADRQDVA